MERGAEVKMELGAGEVKEGRGWGVTRGGAHDMERESLSERGERTKFKQD